ncbi:MAG: flagellar filament capping protein FliD [Magnetococcales bacterium]|nr:flagellar filament capping protein FliD [Magnetococcales bacterium]
MSGSFAINGLASGLPSDIVDQLMSTKQQRLKSYENDVNFFSNQKTAFGELKTKLLNLSSVASTLQDASSWSPHTSSSSDESVLSVSASSEAVSGTHQVSVSRLASSNTLMSGGGVTSDTDTVSAITTFSFKYNGQSYTNADFGIVVGDTLADISEKIGNFTFTDANGDDETGISASVLNDGTSYRLVLTAKDQGAYIRSSDGSTSNPRIENLTVDLTFEDDSNNQTATWNTGGNSSGISTGSGLTDATATLSSIASADFKFTYNGVTYDLDGTNTQLLKNGAALVAGVATLEDVATAISQTVPDMSASVVDDGTNNYLVIDGSTAGQTISAVTVNFSFSNGESVNTSTSGFFTSSEGQDAKLTVDGLSNIYSSSNVVDEVLPGVSMTLKEVTSSAVSISVADDSTTMKETLNSFVEAYNSVVGYINENKETVFTGASLTRTVVSQMRSLLNSSTHDSDGLGAALSPYSMLAEVGLRTDQKTGMISFDSSTLDDAISTSFTNFTSLFTNTQTEVGTGNNAGLAYRFEDLIDEITNSTSGSLTGRSDGLQARIDRLEDSIERENTRLEQVRERLVAKFSSLEQLVNSMNASGSALTSALSGLNK